ncbi:beta-galactosidase [Brachybacterium sp. J144]|uniref:beta-galactosidase n=1 Tax=Brachybacterium sp. J144 TaxID=3116487 RepID=UPI002E7981C8|nr:beta-galactosidase [Brachybacterium sp. J144]MEE1650184.1 beta-galactosidase [Brachybacterium sp. J144]
MTRGDYAPAQVLFGGDWSPEQWDPATWDEDLALMRRAKVNTVTLGVFSWSALEPTEGAFVTDWLDEILERITAAGIGFFLATPTASPPPWFTRVHPDALPVRPDGTRLTHGSRDTYAISAPAYREASRRIARRLAERYGDHPGLRGWHLHNEYGTLDHGPHAERAFQAWLARRYGTIDALNRAWTTAFWSQGYADFAEITPPRATQYLPNPAQAIDFRRFSSDEMLAAMVEQREEIRAVGSTAPVTTNFMLPTWNHLEQWSWADEQDVVSLDHYLDTVGPDAEAHVAYGSDLARSWSGGPWVLMEQNARGIRVDGRTVAKGADRMIRHCLGYIARGSQSSLFFQWRQSAGGSEQWHGALVPHAGGDTRGFAAVERLGGILERLAAVTALPADGPLVRSEVGILWHADAWWALETPDLPSSHLSYSAEVRATHRSFWRAGIPVDFVRPLTDLSAHRLLVLAAQYPLSDAQVTWLEEFVEGGGELVVTYLSGLADEHLRIATGGYPGRLRELLGVRGEELLPLPAGERITLSDGSEAEGWTELLETTDAEVLAAYTHGELASLPAITRARRGAGRVTYVSAGWTQEARDQRLSALAAELGITPTLPGAAERGLEVVRRRSAGADHLFLLHHGAAPVTVRADGQDLLSGDSATGGLRLEPGESAVLSLAPDAPITLLED